LESIPIEVLFYILEAVAVLVVLGIAFFIWKQMHNGRHQRHAEKVIHALGFKYIHNAVLPDGIDGLVFIDYLLLSPSGFIVLDLEHIEGHLFGGNTVDQWSQVVNNKTYKFNNPLYANQNKCQAVIWNIKQRLNTEELHGCDVQGWVAFTHAGDFPKGIPDQISMADDLAQNLGGNIDSDNAISDALINAWDTLNKISSTTRSGNTVVFNILCHFINIYILKNGVHYVLEL